MKQLSVLIKPASSLCNLRCRYCFYTDVSRRRHSSSYGLMRRETATALIESVYRDLTDVDSVSFVFQGGEPTLAGLPFYAFFADQVRRQTVRANVSYALQTNGVLLDGDWCAFLREHCFLVGLSLDGDAALHNENRVDARGRGSFSQVMAAKRLLERERVDYNVLSVLTGNMARHPWRMWRFILQQGIRYIQFIPCLGNLEQDSADDWMLTPRRFYEFYSALFPLWQKEVLRGNYISVKLFDDIVNLFLRHEITACGLDGRCRPQFVVEADGGAYPCDFYVLDKFRLGNLAELTPENIYAKALETGFTEPCIRLPDVCSDCRYLSHCNGGCKRQRWHMYVDDTGFCGFAGFLDEHLEALCRTGALLLSDEFQAPPRNNPHTSALRHLNIWI